MLKKSKSYSSIEEEQHCVLPSTVLQIPPKSLSKVSTINATSIGRNNVHDGKLYDNGEPITKVTPIVKSLSSNILLKSANRIEEAQYRLPQLKSDNNINDNTKNNITITTKPEFLQNPEKYHQYTSQDQNQDQQVSIKKIENFSELLHQDQIDVSFYSLFSRLFKKINSNRDIFKSIQ